MQYCYTRHFTATATSRIMATLWSTSRTVESTLLDKPSESPLKRPEQRRTVLEGVNGLQFQPAPPQNPMTSQTLDSHGLRAVRSSVFLSNAEPIAGKEEVMPSPTGKKRNKLSYHRTALACGKRSTPNHCSDDHTKKARSLSSTENQMHNGQRGS